MRTPSRWLVLAFIGAVLWLLYLLISVRDGASDSNIADYDKKIAAFRKQISNALEKASACEGELRSCEEKAAADPNNPSPPSSGGSGSSSSSSSSAHRPARMTTAVVVMCYNRPDYLKRTLHSVLKYIPETMPFIISQDGDDPQVAAVIRSFSSRVLHIQNHPRASPDPSVNPKSYDSTEALISLTFHHSYGYISLHYKFALSTVFDRLKYDNLIILEDDMEIAPDMFDYFAALTPLLYTDTSLLCISAWNDNGKKTLVRDSLELRRTDVFPGLGWVMTSRLWAELRDKWPIGWWDDWLRDNKRRKGRQCIYPEISRTFTFGEKGSSMGQFYQDHLANIRLNEEAVLWSDVDLSYLTKTVYEKRLRGQIESATPISNVREVDAQPDARLVLRYENQAAFERIATFLHLMSDFKDGEPRTGYKGIVKVRTGASGELFICPNTIRWD